RRPVGAPEIAERIADTLVIGVARQVDKNAALLLIRVGKVELEERVGLDPFRFGAAIATKYQDAGRLAAIPLECAVVTRETQDHLDRMNLYGSEAKHHEMFGDHEVVI